MQTNLIAFRRVFQQTHLFLVIASLAGLLASPETHAQLPKAERVIEKYVKAIGGEEAFRSYKSQKIEGTFTMRGQNVQGALTIYAAQPDKLLVHIEIPNVGSIRNGYNGEVGWSMEPSSPPRVLKGQELAEMKEQADYFQTLHPKENYQTMETEALMRFKGQPAYQLNLVSKAGVKTTEYFHEKNGYLIGAVTTRSTPIGDITITNMMSDYRKFGKIMQPTRITQEIGPLTQVMQFNSFTYNEVDPDVFQLPPEIQSLVGESN